MIPMENKYKLGDRVKFNKLGDVVEIGEVVSARIIIPFFVVMYRIIYSSYEKREEVKWIKEIDILYKVDENGKKKG